MTAVSERGSRAGRPAVPARVLAPLPQVNLLPPEVSAARGVRRTQRWLAVGLLVVLVLCLMGWGGSMLVQDAAQDDLVQAQGDTAAIQAQTQQYAEVPQVLQQLDQAEQAQQYGMAADVLWANYIGAIVAVLPPDVKIESISSTLSTAAQAATLTPDPLTPGGIGELQLVGRTTTLPDTADWIEGLDGVPGFAGVRMSTMAVAADADDGTTFYRVTLKVQVTDDALSGRYVPGGSETSADGAATEGTEG